MNPFSRLFSKSKKSKAEQVMAGDTNHVLMITIQLAQGEFGDKGEISLIRELEDQLESAVEKNSIGEYDGDVFGNNECTIYIYGQSVDELLSVTQPILERFPIKPILVYLQYGPASDKYAKEKRIVIN